MKHDDGGDAFPCSGTEGVNPEAIGMTLADYFAGQALPQLAKYPASAAKTAYEIADSMIAEKRRREKEELNAKFHQFRRDNAEVVFSSRQGETAAESDEHNRVYQEALRSQREAERASRGEESE